MNKSTLFLIAILAILAVIVIVILPSSEDREISYELPISAVKIDSASIVKIEITQPKGGVVLENIGGRWDVTSPIHASADPVAIAQLLNGFSAFKIGSLISTNPEKQKLFQVDSSGTKLTFTDRTGKPTSMIIGKMGPSFSELYFRLPDSKEVYLGEGVDTWIINKTVKEWRNKTIYRTLAESIKVVAVSTPAKEFLFSRDSDGWRHDGKTLDNNELNPMLTTLSNLRADDFVDTVTEINLKPTVVSVRGTDNVSFSIYPVSPDSGKYFLRSTNSPQLYIVNKWTVQQIMQPTGKKVAGAKPVSQEVIAEEKTDREPPEPVKTEGGKPAAEKPKRAQRPVTKAVQKPLVKDTQKKTDETPLKPSVTDRKAEAVRKADVVEKKEEPVRQIQEQPKSPLSSIPDDEGELIVHTVAKGESMTTIAKKYNVTAEKVIRWNLLKSISVKPGQELYIYVKK